MKISKMSSLRRMDQTRTYTNLSRHGHNFKHNIRQAFGHKFVSETTSSESDADWDMHKVKNHGQGWIQDNLGTAQIQDI